MRTARPLRPKRSGHRSHRTVQRPRHRNRVASRTARDPLQRVTRRAFETPMRLSCLQAEGACASTVVPTCPHVYPSSAKGVHNGDRIDTYGWRLRVLTQCCSFRALRRLHCDGGHIALPLTLRASAGPSVASAYVSVGPLAWFPRCGRQARFQVRFTGMIVSALAYETSTPQSCTFCRNWITNILRRLGSASISLAGHASGEYSLRSNSGDNSAAGRRAEQGGY